MAIVIKPFTLLLDEGVPRSVSVGENVTGKLAKHWYVEHHCDNSQPIDAEDMTEDAELSAESVRTKKKGK